MRGRVAQRAYQLGLALGKQAGRAEARRSRDATMTPSLQGQLSLLADDTDVLDDQENDHGPDLAV